MTILIGGNFASGAARTGWAYQSAETGMGNRLKLVKPSGYDTFLQATTTQRDYADSGSYRAELSAPSPLALWGKVFSAAWRIIVPPNWQTYSGEAATTVLQMHDVNIGAASRRPSFAGEIQDGVLSLKLSHDDATGGDSLASMPVSPGQEIAVGLNVRWADGTNEPLANGFTYVYLNGVLAGSRTGRNHWASVDPNPPYIKAGVYVPSTASWWDGKSRTMWHRGAVLGDANESQSDLDALLRAVTVLQTSQVALDQ